MAQSLRALPTADERVSCGTRLCVAELLALKYSTVISLEEIID